MVANLERGAGTQDPDSTRKRSGGPLYCNGAVGGQECPCTWRRGCIGYAEVDGAVDEPEPGVSFSPLWPTGRTLEKFDRHFGCRGETHAAAVTELYDGGREAKGPDAPALLQGLCVESVEPGAIRRCPVLHLALVDGKSDLSRLGGFQRRTLVGVWLNGLLSRRRRWRRRGRGRVLCWRRRC